MLADQVFKVLLGLAAATRVAAKEASFREGPYHGVNLGGWLVTEPWITPSLFEEQDKNAVDEYTLSKALGAGAQARLEKHWNSFITAQDFQEIKQAGLSHVRIPVGYWAVKPRDIDPYVSGQLAYLDKAIEWARQSKLGVIVDLHGAPGSQNGFDNSGRNGSAEWQTGEGNVEHTVQTLEILAEQYAQHKDVVAAIELLNEPAPQVEGIEIEPLKKFYKDAYAAVRAKSPDIPIVISDAFQQVATWNGFMAPKDNYNDVIVDTHHYEVFDADALGNNITTKVEWICKIGKEDLSQTDKKAFCGEWSGALTDCAKFLNGRQEGARYDGTYPDSEPLGNCDNKASGSVARLPAKEREDTRKLVEAQLDSYQMGEGWFFWTWKTEGKPAGWDLKDLIQNDVFPQPLDARRYPGQCK